MNCSPLSFVRRGMLGAGCEVASGGDPTGSLSAGQASGSQSKWNFIASRSWSTSASWRDTLRNHHALTQGCAGMFAGQLFQRGWRGWSSDTRSRISSPCGSSQSSTATEAVTGWGWLPVRIRSRGRLPSLP